MIAKDREAAVAAMQEVMGPLPGEDHRVPLEVRVHEERQAGSVRYRKISFAAEPGDRAVAWLLGPVAPARCAPGVICLHQTTAIGKDEPAGLGGLPNLHYALELAQRGFVTLAPDYPGYGEYRVNAYRLGYASATMKGIWNHLRAVDVLAEMPEVAPGGVGCIGHSLGGHNTLFLAAFDPRIAAAVSSCGFSSFTGYESGDLTGWSHLGYMPRIASEYGTDAARIPFEFCDVLAAIAPRRLFVNAPEEDSFPAGSVDECVAAVRDRYQGLDEVQVVHPPGGHDFPPPVREQAYAFLAAALPARYT